MIYSPAEDSYLLEKQVKRFSKNKNVLDIGAGSGIQALAAKKAGAKTVIASDISEHTIEHLKKLGLNAIKSNLLKNINGKFDLIIFNPPYLPEDKQEDKESQLSTTGGKKGDELILKFLKQSIKHLNKNGIILLLVSSLTPMEKIDKFIKKENLKKEVIDSTNLFMESLDILKISF